MQSVSATAPGCPPALQGSTFINNALSGAVSGMFASALLQVRFNILLRNAR
jgi:hypothetical protein